jgi:hypothetical protein
MTVKFKTKEKGEIADKNNGHALEYVPDELKTDDICKKAVKNLIYALKYVPETGDVCKDALK